MRPAVSATVLRIVVYVSLFLIITSLWGFYTSVRPPRILSSITPRSLGMNYEDVSFTTADGLTLSGWYIARRPASEKTLILLHGYPADKGNILPLLAFLNEDFNLLLFDFRYLGQSGGKYSTAGAREVEDLLTAVRYLKKRGIAEVGVWGFSMGGAVALMAIEKAPEIKAVVSESSYASLDGMARQLFRIPVLEYPLAFLLGIWSKVFLGVDLSEVSPARSVRGVRTPVLLIHSTADAVIPISHAKTLQEALSANPHAEFWFKDDLAHGQLGGDYRSRVKEFFQRHL